MHKYIKRLWPSYLKYRNFMDISLAESYTSDRSPTLHNEQQLGPLTYMIEVAAGKFWKRFVDYGKDYPSKGLSLAPESPETGNNENEIFSAPVKVSDEENNTSSGENPMPVVKKITSILPMLQIPNQS